VVLDAGDSRDPDRQQLRFAWEVYPEPGSYRGPAPMVPDADSAKASFIAPDVKLAQTLHLIVSVTDTGTPPLTRYRRVIVTVKP
jgi:hypothetical protein